MDIVAYYQGRFYGFAGLPEWFNPYPYGTSARASWAQGHAECASSATANLAPATRFDLRAA